MIAVGVGHFVNPLPFVQHLPEWVPAREAIVYVTGAMEIAFGVALVFAPVRRRTHVGWALAGFFVAVFPANVYVAVADVEVEGYPPDPWPWIRLPFQLVLVAWALWSTGAWPRQSADA
jgi:uncharacterized membrane protein